MKCQGVIDRLSAALDDGARGKGLKALERHLSRCPDCALRYHQLRQLRSTLGSMPSRVPPPELTIRLRIAASQARLWRDRGAGFGFDLRHWSDVFGVWAGNLMRPLALPFAGGLLSAIFLFSMLAPMYGVAERASAHDVPTSLSTKASLHHSSISFGNLDEDIVVEVFVDGEGRMVDYAVPAGQVWQFDPQVRRYIENALLCTRFVPATMFGQPTSGSLRITLRRNQVDVKG